MNVQPKLWSFDSPYDSQPVGTSRAPSNDHHDDETSSPTGAAAHGQATTTTHFDDSLPHALQKSISDSRTAQNKVFSTPRPSRSADWPCTSPRKAITLPPPPDVISPQRRSSLARLRSFDDPKKQSLKSSYNQKKQLQRRSSQKQLQLRRAISQRIIVSPKSVSCDDTQVTATTRSSDSSATRWSSSASSGVPRTPRRKASGENDIEKLRQHLQCLSTAPSELDDSNAAFAPPFDDGQLEWPEQEAFDFDDQQTSLFKGLASEAEVNFFSTIDDIDDDDDDEPVKPVRKPRHPTKRLSKEISATNLKDVAATLATSNHRFDTNVSLQKVLNAKEKLEKARKDAAGIKKNSIRGSSGSVAKSTVTASSSSTRRHPPEAEHVRKSLTSPRGGGSKDCTAFDPSLYVVSR